MLRQKEGARRPRRDRERLLLADGIRSSGTASEWARSVVTGDSRMGREGIKLKLSVTQSLKWEHCTVFEAADTESKLLRRIAFNQQRVTGKG